MKAKPLFYASSLFAFFFLHFSYCSAQWQWQNPLPQGNSLNDVFFIDQNSGWTVGDAGTIMKTVDGGLTYNLFSFPTHANLTAIEFFNEDMGLATGSSGMILKSSDGGINWSRIETEFTDNMTDLFMIDNLTWIIGDNGSVIYSSDFGETWQLQFSDTTMSFNSISFLNENLGWAAGNYESYASVLLSTIDGGNSWTTIPSGIQGPFIEIYFTDTLVGWASVYDGENIVKTTDGGNSWTFIEEFEGHFYDMMFKDSLHGWMVGDNGAIPVSAASVLYTENGGETWIAGDIGGLDWWYGEMLAVFFFDIDHGWAAGTQGNIMRTTDGGHYWNITIGNPCPGRSFFDIFFIDEKDGWVVGGNFYPGFSKILHTTDGGNSWTEQVAPTYNILNSVYFTSPLEGWITGKLSLGDYYSEILHTTDGGNSWEIQHYIDFDQGTYTDVWFTDPLHGWAVGEVGHTYPPPLQSLIYHTLNGGDTWMDYSYLASNAISSVFFTDSQHGWMAGHKVILHTSSGGQIWEEIWTGPHYLRDIFFTDEQHGWAVGDSASRHPFRDVIMRTIDGGVTWEEQFPGLGSYEKSIFFTDNDHGWIARDEGDILFTIDGGITWDHMFINTNDVLGGIWFNDIDHGWVVGGNDAIFHIDNGSIVGVKEEARIQPPTFNFQHYPNPACGIVDCRLSIFDGRWVVVKVYDIHGREVMNVLDQKMPAGEHAVRFDLSGFSNGIYFLRVIAGEESVSRKIVLKE